MTEAAHRSAEGTTTGCPLSSFVQGYWRLADWQLSAQECLGFLRQHVELGITSVDHADIYGDYRCEELFGEALRLDPALRDQLQLVTKCGIQLLSSRFPQRRVKHYDTSAAHIERSVENSLKRLHTDRIELLLVHRPDPLLDADELATAFEHLRQSGKVLHFGVSNFTPAQFELLQSRLDRPLVTNQVEINPLNTGVLWDGTLDQLQMLRRQPMAWSCLAGGLIFGTDAGPAHRVRLALEQVAQELDAGADQAAYAWVLKLPSRPIPILGSGNIDRARSTLAAGALELSREQWFRILEASTTAEVP